MVKTGNIHKQAVLWKWSFSGSDRILHVKYVYDGCYLKEDHRSKVKNDLYDKSSMLVF